MNYLICKEDINREVLTITRDSTGVVVEVKVIDTIQFKKDQEYLISRFTDNFIELSYDEDKKVGFAIMEKPYIGYEFYENIFYPLDYFEYKKRTKELDSIPFRYIEKYLREKKLNNLSNNFI